MHFWQPWGCSVPADRNTGFNSQEQFDFDFVVIGSGFGGSVAAYRLAEKGYRLSLIHI